jgi:hypothetical protein
MKKFLIIVFSIIILLLACIYVFIPGKLEVSKLEYMKCNVNGAYRILSNENTWQKWWPEKDGFFKKDKSGKQSFFYRGFKYQLVEKYYNAVGVKIKSDKSTIDSKINVIKINIDSVVLMWKCEIKTGINPVSRFLKYREAKDIRQNMTVILGSLRSYLEDKKNIYGIDLQVIMSKDSTMVLITNVSKKYPTTSEIYELIGNLKKYIAEEKAKENNFPMLHVKKLPDSTFETMVAIPVNKKLPGNGTISFSRFVPWKVLRAEVKGGNATVEEALHQMKIFISDYQKTAMAIPFESLVTDRSKEPDTSKWITRIYTPVP